MYCRLPWAFSLSARIFFSIVQERHEAVIVIFQKNPASMEGHQTAQLGGAPNVLISMTLINWNPQALCSGLVWDAVNCNIFDLCN